MMLTSGDPPQVVAFPFEVKLSLSSSLSGVIILKIYSKLNRQSEVNGGSFPNNSVDQLFLFPRVIPVTTFLLLVVEFLLMGGQRGTSQVVFCSILWGGKMDDNQGREKHNVLAYLLRVFARYVVIAPFPLMLISPQHVKSKTFVMPSTILYMSDDKCMRPGTPFDSNLLAVFFMVEGRCVVRISGRANPRNEKKRYSKNNELTFTVSPQTS